MIRELHLRKDVRNALSAYLEGADVGTDKQLATAWESKRQLLVKNSESINARFGTFSRCRFTSAALENLVIQLNEIEQKLMFDLDRQRVRRLAESADCAHKFSNATEFEEKELNYQLATTQLDALISDIVDNPTKQSHESFIPRSEEHTSE